MRVFDWLQRLFAKCVATKVCRQLHLLDCQIHGSHYYACLELVQADKLQKNERLALLREPDNEYDEYAIAVWTEDNRQLGYLPKNHNRVIAALMDQHCEIDATIQTIEKAQWEPVTIRVELRL